MNTSLIKAIVEQFLNATGHKGSGNHTSKEILLAQNTTYTSDQIYLFIEDLVRYARQEGLALIMSDMPQDEFATLLARTDHPILYFEQEGSQIVPIIAGKDYKGNSIEKKIVDNGKISTANAIPKSPYVIQNEVDTSKNGKVLFIIAFPLEPLVSTTTNGDSKEPISPIRRLWLLLRNEGRDIGYIYFYAIVVGLISLILPLGIGSIFNLVSSGMIFSSIYVLMGLVIAGLVISGVLQIVQITLVEILQRRIFAKTAYEFSYRLPRFKAETFDQYNLAELMNRFFDVLAIQKTLPKFLIDITAAGLQIIFGLLLLSFYHPFFIAFSAVILVIFVVIIRINGWRGLETSIIESKYKYKVAAWLEGVANTIFPFKMAASASLPVQKIDGLINGYLTYRGKHFEVLKSFYYYALIFKTLVISGLLILGTFLLVNREITLGEFVASEIVIVLLTGAVEKLFLSIDSVFDLLTAVDKIGSVTDIELEKDGGFKFVSDKKNNGLQLTIQNLHYTYPNATHSTLSDINLNIQSGERICITGGNGSGKHTLLKVLSGILSDYQGAMLYNGLSLRDLELTSLRAHVEMNFPNQEIFDGSILENLTMGRANIPIEVISKVLSQLNINDEIAALPDGLSTQMIAGGRRLAHSFITKIALARCLLTKPKLLLITDALQDIEQPERLRLIEFLTNKDHSYTLIVLSNDPAFMAACDKVVVMKAGKITATGDYKTILKHLAS